MFLSLKICKIDFVAEFIVPCNPMIQISLGIHGKKEATLTQ